jgi:hypothetical protein
MARRGRRELNGQGYLVNCAWMLGVVILRSTRSLASGTWRTRKKLVWRSTRDISTDLDIKLSMKMALAQSFWSLFFAGDPCGHLLSWLSSGVLVSEELAFSKDALTVMVWTQ